ncbi:MAG: DUF4062 domain-containing protein [Desulfovibrionaceae bacterium]
MGMKYQIFVSSTYADLRNARRKVMDAISSLQHFPVGMELFSADNDGQWDVITRTIDESDYYVVIIGHRYGSVADDGISYTEKEYDYAVKKGIPVLAFIRSRDIATTPAERDSDHCMSEMLDRFIEKATKNKMCDFWEMDDELSTKVVVALAKIFSGKPRTGWVRSDNAISPALSEEMAELSRENRALRDEVQSLKIKFNARKPKIGVKINDATEVFVIYRDNKKMMLEVGGRDMEMNFVCKPDKIDYDDVPSHLVSYVSRDDVDNYNASIPEDDDIERFNKELEGYWRAKSCSSQFAIFVENTGSVKAKNIVIKITTPDGVLALDKDDVEGLKFPSSPLPKNPILNAQEKYNQNLAMRNAPIWAQISRIDQPFPMSYGNHFSDLAARLAASGPPKGYCSYIDGEVIVVQIDELMHTMSFQLSQYVIVPLSTGDFKINISVICEEYAEAEEIGISITSIQG